MEFNQHQWSYNTNGQGLGNNRRSLMIMNDNPWTLIGKQQNYIESTNIDENRWTPIQHNQLLKFDVDRWTSMTINERRWRWVKHEHNSLKLNEIDSIDEGWMQLCEKTLSVNKREWQSIVTYELYGNLHRWAPSRKAQNRSAVCNLDVTIPFHSGAQGTISSKPHPSPLRRNSAIAIF